MSDNGTGNNSGVFVDPKALSILQGIFGATLDDETPPSPEEELPKTASVKFMITIQDEKELRELGYTQTRIDRMKPEEAREILEAGTKAGENEP